MIRRLSSIRLSFWGLVAMILWLAAGMGLAYSDIYRGDLKSLGETLVLRWLINDSLESPEILFWFLGICLVSFVILVNLLCCSLTRLKKMAFRGFRPGRVSLFVIHIVFAAVMFCHALSMVTGFKTTGVELFSGGSAALENGWDIKVTDVVFTDDKALAGLGYRKSRGLMTRESIHRENNMAHVSISHKGRILADGNVRILDPFVFKEVRVTLVRFILSGDRENVGVNLTVSRGPLNGLFFILYGVLILFLSIYLFRTWSVDSVQAAASV